MKVLVTGAGGFIGGHLVNNLVGEGHEVVAVDIKPLAQWEQHNLHAHSLGGHDLREMEVCRAVFMVHGPFNEVYNLAASMGGMGFIETHKLECMLNVQISTNMLEAARQASVDRFFYSSSACVYKADAQLRTDLVALREEDAYPAMPEDGYGWEKLFSERMAVHYNEETDMTVRVARYHNVYGTHTSWTGGREKAPAAICRKVAEAKISGSGAIEIWGDGQQTRSFMFHHDCVYGTERILRSDVVDYPINLGSSEMVSINQLVSMVEAIAGVELERSYNLAAPKGVRGRNSDNTRILRDLDWEPSITLMDGLDQTFAWVYDQVKASA
jgi:GDP-D-mannose 3', 5'-epimerase